MRHHRGSGEHHHLWRREWPGPVHRTSGNGLLLCSPWPWMGLRWWEIKSSVQFQPPNELAPLLGSVHCGCVVSVPHQVPCVICKPKNIKLSTCSHTPAEDLWRVLWLEGSLCDTTQRESRVLQTVVRLHRGSLAPLFHRMETLYSGCCQNKAQTILRVPPHLGRRWRNTRHNLRCHGPQSKNTHWIQIINSNYQTDCRGCRGYKGWFEILTHPFHCPRDRGVLTHTHFLPRLLFFTVYNDVQLSTLCMFVLYHCKLFLLPFFKNLTKM